MWFTQVVASLLPVILPREREGELCCCPSDLGGGGGGVGCSFKDHSVKQDEKQFVYVSYSCFRPVPVMHTHAESS